MRCLELRASASCSTNRLVRVQAYYVGTDYIIIIYCGARKTGSRVSLYTLIQKENKLAAKVDPFLFSATDPAERPKTAAN